jgi:hypothetical protein
VGRPSGEPRAIIVLVVDGAEHRLGEIAPGVRCDLALVDHLLRIQLEARRADCSIRLIQVDPDLDDLVTRVGVADVLEE